jgi:hypothetical protein
MVAWVVEESKKGSKALLATVSITGLGVVDVTKKPELQSPRTCTILLRWSMRPSRSQRKSIIDTGRIQKINAKPRTQICL